MPGKNKTDAAIERPGGIRGKYAVFATLSLFIIVPAVSVGIGLMLRSTSVKPIELNYDQQAEWFTQPVKSRPLKYSKFVAAETGKQYKKTDLVIEPEVEAVLRRCVALAQADDFASNQETLEKLWTYAKDPANGFYPLYLVATWHKLNGNQAAQDQWMSKAYERAGGAICQRFVDEKKNPVAGYAIPPVAIGYDRVTDGKLNATLFLVYPGLVTDERGMIYLPTYRSVYRLTDPALPIGSDPGLHPTKLTLLPQPFIGTEPNWFSAPDGAVGQLPEAIISLSDQAIQEVQQQLEEPVGPTKPPLKWDGRDEQSD